MNWKLSFVAFVAFAPGFSGAADTQVARHFHGGLSFGTAKCQYVGGIEADFVGHGSVKGTIHYSKPVESDQPVKGSVNDDGTVLTFESGALKLISSNSSKALEKSQGIFYGGARFEG